MAFFPAETLVEYYSVMDGAVRVMTGLVGAAQGMVVAAILAGLVALLDLQRRRFAVLRAMGATRSFVFLVVWLYVAVLILAGAMLGLPLGWATSTFVTRLISEATGVAMTARLGMGEVWLAAVVAGMGLLLAALPALRIARSPPLATESDRAA